MSQTTTTPQNTVFRGIFRDNNSNECPRNFRELDEYWQRLDNLATINYLEEKGMKAVTERVSDWLEDGSHGPNVDYYKSLN